MLETVTSNAFDLVVKLPLGCLSPISVHLGLSPLLIPITCIPTQIELLTDNFSLTQPLLLCEFEEWTRK